ncbi:hypothetical protein ACHAWF_004635 [Thalassiosira exigua]
MRLSIHFSSGHGSERTRLDARCRAVLHARRSGRWELVQRDGGKLDPEHPAATNLYYCGLQVPGARRAGSPGIPPKQTWVDTWGNALSFSSAGANPNCVENESTSCEYGPSGAVIDTEHEVNVTVRFDWNDDGGFLEAFSTTLTQGSQAVTLTRNTTGNAWHVPVDGGFPSDGKMALLLQLWTSPRDDGMECGCLARTVRTRMGRAWDCLRLRMRDML